MSRTFRTRRLGSRLTIEDHRFYKLPEALRESDV